MPVLLTLPPKVAEKQACAHCQSLCMDDRLRIGDHHFCCEGCKMVFEILDSHNLCDFYTLDKNAGKSLEKPKFTKDYAYLEDPEVAEKLLTFIQDETAQITFYLPQMHCVSCIWLLENLYKLDAGVTHSKVNFLKKTTTIQFNPNDITLRKLVTLLASIGYAPDLNLGDLDKQKFPTLSRRLAYQLGVAGFAFGNIMLFSFPEYLGMSRGIDPWFSKAFGYLSLLLAMPVLLFSASDYFKAAWRGLRAQQLNIEVPLCLALASLFIRSVWEIWSQTGSGYLDSFAGLTFLLLIGKWFQQHVWHQLSYERDYKSYFPVSATIRNGDKETSVPVSRLIPGDIIMVHNQEIIPADGILLKGSALIDYSFVTGESDPVLLQCGERVFAGGKQVGEKIELTLTAKIAQSHLTQLWNNEAFKPNAKGDVTLLADAAGRYFTIIILAFGAGAFGYWWLLQGNIQMAINASTAVMIVACPCTVALSIPFTLGNILRILGRHGFYLKNIQVVEAFANINTVVCDKTGTITRVAQREMNFQGQSLTNFDRSAIRSLVSHSVHPLSRRIYESMFDVEVLKSEKFEEIPGLGIQGMVEGRLVKIGSAAFVGSKQNEAGVFVMMDGVLLGHYEVKNQYREGLEGVLAFFRKLTNSPTSNLFLLSGDQDRDAASLAPFFPDSQMMRFNLSPQDKLDFIKKLQLNKFKVLMLGDGLNDAGALRQSDLGIVVTENTNNFTPACDAILKADAFAQLPAFIRLAQKGVSIVNYSYFIALFYNAIGLSFAISGVLSPLVAAVLMPISSVSIVLFGVGMSHWAARSLIKDL